MNEYMNIISNPAQYEYRYTAPEITIKFLKTLIPNTIHRNTLLSIIRLRLTACKETSEGALVYMYGPPESGKSLFIDLVGEITDSVRELHSTELLRDNSLLGRLSAKFISVDEYDNYLSKSIMLTNIKRLLGFGKVIFATTSNKTSTIHTEYKALCIEINTPNSLREQGWVQKLGGTSDLVSLIRGEFKDFCYYLTSGLFNE